VQRGVTPTPAPKPAAPAAARNGEQGWTPAAAFTDREAAGRLAGSIKQQGYPVEIRQDPASSRPWVVWIGAQPRSGERRR
jgi:cell division septation protein DedD